MWKFRFGIRLLISMILFAANLLMSACSPASPIEQAYYTGGGSFSIAGGYTRTIFSSHNF